MESREIQELLIHMEWADAAMWNTLLSLDQAARDSRLLDLLYHQHTVQWVYLQVWQGEPLKVPERKDFAELTAIAAWARRYYGLLRSFAGTLISIDPSHEVKFPWAEEIAKRLGSAAPATLGESILQVVLHSTYHRAQAASRIRELGGEPPLTDFISWIWRAKPDPAW